MTIEKNLWIKFLSLKRWIAKDRYILVEAQQGIVKNLHIIYKGICALVIWIEKNTL